MEEQNLIDSAKKGDNRAKARLIEKYRGYIYTIAYKTSLNQDDALDITQNTMLTIVKKLETYAGKGSFKSWVATIAAREAISYMRKFSANREFQTEPEMIEQLESPRPEAQNPRAEAHKTQQLERIEKAMAKLSPQQRLIVTLYVHEDLLPREIADRLDIPAAQIRVQLHRALKKLRALLQET